MVSGIVTLVLLLLFVGGWIWAWSPRRKRDFDEAAQLPLADEVPPADRAADDIHDGNGNKNGESAR